MNNLPPELKMVVLEYLDVRTLLLYSSKEMPGEEDRKDASTVCWKSIDRFLRDGCRFKGTTSARGFGLTDAIVSKYLLPPDLVLYMTPSLRAWTEAYNDHFILGKKSFLQMSKEDSFLTSVWCAIHH